MNKIVYYCQGESHKATNKVCQDYTKCIIEDDLAIAALSDGHGGNRYFRSDYGSRTAVECTISKVKDFIKNIDSSIFSDKPFTAISALTTERKQSIFRKNSEIDRQLQRLFASIIFSWRSEVESHAHDNPFSDEEAALIGNPNDPSSIDKTYGCTLMCFAKTSKYWFAFHIGDGKCFSFDKNGGWTEPIPWDERCFLNKTTSLCDSDSIEEFRYCYQGDGDFPAAVFLASDGLDDSFGEDVNQANFYIQILKLIAKTSSDDAQKEIEESLPQLSKIGSKDDMSLSIIYDETELTTIINPIILWQRDNIKKQIEEVNTRLENLRNQRIEYSPFHFYSRKELIDAQYVVTEIERLFESKRSLAEKYNKFTKELGDSMSLPYQDSIGLYEYPEEGTRKNITCEQIKKRLRVLNHPLYKFE